jgi:hypothetical protein
VDFSSYCDALPDYLELFTVRMYRAEVDLVEYEQRLMNFLGEVDDLERRLRARAPLKVAA